MESPFALPAQHRIEKPLASQDALPRALVRDLNSNLLTLALTTGGAHAERLLARKGLRHRHLALINTSTKEEDRSTFLAEYVPGTTLWEARASKPIDPFKALIWFTRLLEALAAVHEAPAVHGAISPLSIMVEPEGRAIAPVLTQLAAPAIGAYASPERLAGEAPCAADDTWSLLACLYFAITGQPPFGNESSEKVRERVPLGKLAPLSQWGVNEPELERLFAAAFQADAGRRLTKITRIREAFDRIERGESLPASLFVGDALSLRPRNLLPENEPLVWDEKAVLADMHGAAPRGPQASLGPDITLGPQISIGPDDSIWPAAVGEPSPKPRATARTKSSAPPPFARKKRPLWPLAFLAGAGAAAVVAAVVMSRNEPEPAPEVAPVPSSIKPLAAKPATKTEVPFSREQCLLSYFPNATFTGSPNLDFFCQTKKFSEGTSLLFALVRAHAERKVQESAPPIAEDARAKEPRRGEKADAGPDPALLAALPYQGELGWYDLAAAAIMKRNCCDKGAQNIDLERTLGYCPQLGDVVQGLADASSQPGDLSPQARRFDEAVTCLITTKTAHSFGYEGVPTPENRAAFQRFLTYAAVSDAKRSALRK
ncbi:MAG: hypothetical protein SFV15_19220 [Polyangiaceae bacterium]|nr:hypothetical protein [Polyangiaceae bacterium]